MFMPLKEDFAVTISFVSWWDRVLYTGMETVTLLMIHLVVTLKAYHGICFRYFFFFLGGERGDVCLEASKVIKKKSSQIKRMLLTLQNRILNVKIKVVSGKLWHLQTHVLICHLLLYESLSSLGFHLIPRSDLFFVLWKDSLCKQSGL